ncbi:MAG: MBL fold metallo-hydrolase [Chloroflexota bacterium]
MDITWLGHSCFRIKGSHTAVITDPFAPEFGELPGKLSADIVTVSHAHPGHSYTDGVSNVKKVVAGPGEYEISGVLILGLATFHDRAGGTEKGTNTVYLMNIDGVTICHLGDLGHVLGAAEIEDLGNIDVLMVPVGGVSTMDATLAAEMVRRLEPKVVIPMHYRFNERDSGLETADRFLGEIGVAEISPQPKLTLTRSKLPLSTQVYLLES